MAAAFRIVAFASLLSLTAMGGAAIADDVPPSAAANTGPHLGVYRWANKPANIDAFADWLGRPTVWAVDFIGGESWDNIQWPVWWLEGWSPWVRAKPGRRLILGVPMLAGPVDRSGPTQGKIDVRLPVSLKDGAAGRYNHHFKQLAENLVTNKLTDSVLRPGWEFNGGWYAWAAKGQAKEFAEYWRQIVTTMRATPGAERLKFCWNPTLGDQDFPADEAWPGDAYVDFVGVDVYDETWNKDTYPWPAGASPDEIAGRRRKVWEEWIMGSPRGLAFWTKFAEKHDKPLAIPEWGLNRRKDGHGGGDNALFIERMHAFVMDPANRVAFHCYFDVNVPGDDHRHQLSPGLDEQGKPDQTEYPNAAAAFRKLFTQKH